MSSRPVPRRTLGLVGLAVASTTLVALPPTATANPAGTALVISEVYGGGGNSGATYTHDFIELYNPTNAPIPVTGHSVEYFSSGGTSGGRTILAGSVPAQGHYLIQQAPGAGGTTPLPAPDATGTASMASTSGSVTLSNGTTVLDLVGYGTTTKREGAAAPALSNSTAATRNAARTDTDDNATDFTAAAPAPQGSGATQVDPSPEPEPTSEKSIAEIQGTGSATPLSGQTVATRGVVTARYETGGYNGFVIQTPGATAGAASHGLFVFGGSGAAGAARAGLVQVGDHVRVTGRVSEFNSSTQITPASNGDIQQLGTDAVVTPAAVPFPADDTSRERLEHMLLAPTGPFTISDNYNLNRFGEMVLAAGDAPLRQPTDVAPHGSAEAAEVKAQNAAQRVVLDDGSTSDYVNHASARSTALPYLTDAPALRVGDPVWFSRPVILSFGFGEWRFQPQAHVTGGDGDSPVTFGPSTRTPAPEQVGGDVQVASFNVLNYFPTTGDQLVGCDYYRDRAGDPVTISGGCNARGAAEAEDFERQQAKIVAAINSLDAEVVSLEEIENSAQFLRDRDHALAQLVEALNTDLGAQVWDYVRSPTLTPAVEREDYIRTGFIYKPAAVKAQGQSVIYDGPEFDRARDPLAQVFKPVSGTAEDKFLLIVNHFKSKGSAPRSPDPDADYGQGGFNALRTTQAEALVRFADELKASTEVTKVFLDGDFNSYTYEDPMEVLYAAGYASLEETYGASPTYLFGGMVGSLDHALANSAALDSTTGADVWNINSVESVAHEYSRHNYNVTQFYAETPYRSSDHDPLVFGIDVR